MSKASTDGWGTRFGLVMAMAGNAVGLGNFLRFPGQAAPHGGVFMVPYLIAFLLLGIPLMWMEWAIGRHGGGYGHGSTPGMLHRLWPHPVSKYFGVIGVVIPACVGLYYILIESWCLGYAIETARGSYWGDTSMEAMAGTFNDYLGTPDDPSGRSFNWFSYGIFLLTFGLNMVILARGVEKGIEIVARCGMPLLLAIGVLLAIRVFTLPPMDGRTVGDGFGLVWRIDDWSALGNPSIWIAASGQIFFTLSLGFGMIHCYASYLRRHDDVVANGLAASATNEFVEVVLGSSIAIPAAVIFFGVTQTQGIAEGGTFSLGFMALPVIFQQMAGGQIWGTLWFLLLFVAALLSSVAMLMPLQNFVEDELRFSRRESVTLIGVVFFLLMQPVILFQHHGIIDEIDFWVGTFGVIVFAAIEAILFAWIFGMDRGWEELHHGADMRVPKIFFYIMKYVTPVYMIGLLAWYAYTSLWDKIVMTGVDPIQQPFLWLGRGIIVFFFVFLSVGVWYAWKTHPKFFDTVETESGEEIEVV